MSQETLEVIRRGYDLWNSGRIDDWAEIFHPEIEFRPSGAMPGLQPVYRGREGIRQLMADLTEALEGFQAEPRELVERGEFVGAVLRFTGKGRGSGVPVEMTFHHAFGFRDGLVNRWGGGRALDEAFEAAGLAE